MAVIFMTGYKKSTKETMIVPVFRLKKDDESDTKYSLYVDLIGRVYQGMVVRVVEFSRGGTVC